MTTATADTQNRLILVSGQKEQLRYVSRIPGAKLRADGVWRLPLTIGSCEELAAQRIPFDEGLATWYTKLRRVQRYIDQVKVKEGPVSPLQPVPIRAPYTLYQHQIKAYNIALALFGRGAKKEATAK